jgi:hypothetical protein
LRKSEPPAEAARGARYKRRASLKPEVASLHVIEPDDLVEGFNNIHFLIARSRRRRGNPSSGGRRQMDCFAALAMTRLGFYASFGQ